jgi:hypothetical protein
MKRARDEKCGWRTADKEGLELGFEESKRRREDAGWSAVESAKVEQDTHLTLQFFSAFSPLPLAEPFRRASHLSPKGLHPRIHLSRCTLRDPQSPSWVMILLFIRLAFARHPQIPPRLPIRPSNPNRSRPILQNLLRHVRIKPSKLCLNLHGSAVRAVV